MKGLPSKLTRLVGDLTRLRIETEFNINNLGVNNQGQLKLYLNHKTKIGCKSDLPLIVLYSQAKDKIMKEIIETCRDVDKKQN